MTQSGFNKDSIAIVLNGGNGITGVLKVASNYSSTAAGNRAHFIAGACYLHNKDFNNAVKHLKDFSTPSKQPQSASYRMLGDAYSELKNYDQAISYYLKAADNKPNIFTTPMYLQKAGLIYEYQKDFTKALDMYSRIKRDYSNSAQSRDIDKFIARVQQH